MKKLLILAAMMLVLGGCSKSDRSAGLHPDGEPIALTFSLSGIGTDASVSGGSVASVGTRAGKAVDLEEGVTVRIVAYQRSGTDANLTADKYIGEATYQAVKDENDAIVLKPCTVTFGSDGKIASVTLAGASPLRLIASTYDIYALTPALQLAAGTGTAPAAPAHTDVAHGDDFAASLTENVQVKSNGQIVQPDPVASGGGPITNPDGKVILSVLDRKCSRICFSTDRKPEKVNVVKSVVIEKVELSDIAHSPATVTLCQPIPTGANDGTYDFPKSTFAKGTEDYEYTVIDEVLPKSDGTFKLSMEVIFNDAKEEDGSDRITPLEAEIPSLPFVAGYRYNFRLWLKGGSIVLLLQITPWDKGGEWDSEIGGYPHLTLEVGEWETDWGDPWDTEVGGYPHLTPTVGSWTPNPEWKTQLGEYLSLIFGGDNNWTDKDWKTDFDS